MRRISHLALIPLCLAALTACSHPSAKKDRAPAEAVPGSLGDLMGKMVGVEMVKLRMSLGRPNGHDASVAAAKEWKDLASKCRDKIPAHLQDDSDKQAYQAMIDQLVDKLGELQIAVEADKIEQARSLIEEVHAIRDAGHMRFKPETPAG